MALDYSLNIKSKHIFSKKLDDYLASKGFLFEKEYGEKLVTFDLFKPLGFIISIFASEKNSGKVRRSSVNLPF